MTPTRRSDSRRFGTGPPKPPAPGSRALQPGQFLESRFLAPLAITQTELAAALGVSRRRVNELIRGRRAITPDTAVRLAAFFGNDPTFWMHLQVAWDMRGAVKQARRQKPRSDARDS